MKPISDEYISALEELGGMLLAFAKVNRRTYLDPERTPESDTDHTVMLAIMACAVAQQLHPDYDLGKVAQYALVHDLVEVYAGDVNTINFLTIDQAAKDAAEAAALQKIKDQFGTHFPWIHETIEAYESLRDPEARFIKTLDKLTPAVAHRHSDNHVVNEDFTDPAAFEKSVRARNKHMRATYAADQEPSMYLRETILEKIIDKKYAHHGVQRRKTKPDGGSE